MTLSESPARRTWEEPGASARAFPTCGNAGPERRRVRVAVRRFYYDA